MKTFVLSDSSVNCYGFRVLTSGIDLPQFQRNPIMLWMHTRGGTDSNNSDQVLPLGVWKNARIEGDRLLAEPEFDMSDGFARRIKDKVDAGILRSASIGLCVMEMSDSPLLKLPGQTLGTAIKSQVREASIVDIGANSNAIALYASGSKAPLPTHEVRLHAAALQMHVGNTDGMASDPAFALSYDELHRGTGLELLKTRNYPLYCLKYYQKFGTFGKGCTLDAAAQKRLSAMATALELSALKAQGYHELHRTGQLARLKELDQMAYGQMVAGLVR